jgi:CheY-like chemotaxis protein
MIQHTFVVDDDAIVLFLMRKLLETVPFDSPVLYYEKSTEALAHFKEIYTPQDQYLFFLDINMPEMDGWEFLRQLEEFTHPSNTFVVIITSSTDLQDRKRAEANAHTRKLLVKPVLQDNVEEIKQELGW